MEFYQAYIDNNQVFLAKEFAEKDLNELGSNLKVYQYKMSEINDSFVRRKNDHPFTTIETND